MAKIERSAELSTPRAAGPDAAEPLSDLQLASVARDAIKLIDRSWFGGRFEREAQPYIVPLLINVFLCHQFGTLARKKEAMKYMKAVDARTAQRYVNMIEKQGLLRIVQSSVDKRVDLLCPSDELIALVKTDLEKLADEIRQSIDAVNKTFPDPVGWISTTALFGPSVLVPAFMGPDVRSVSSLARPRHYGEKSDKRAFLIFDETHFTRQIASFSEAIQLMPTNPAAWRGRAETHIQLARLMRDNNAINTAKAELAKGIADYTEAIRLSPTTTSLYMARAAAFITDRDWVRGMADIEEVIRQHPHAGFAYNMRAEAYMVKGDLKKAEADFRRSKKYGGALAMKKSEKIRGKSRSSLNYAASVETGIQPRRPNKVKPPE